MARDIYPRKYFSVTELQEKPELSTPIAALKLCSFSKTEGMQKALPAGRLAETTRGLNFLSQGWESRAQPIALISFQLIGKE